jgi:hypothetical protein
MIAALYGPMPKIAEAALASSPDFRSAKKARIKKSSSKILSRES